MHPSESNNDNKSLLTSPSQVSSRSDETEEQMEDVNEIEGEKKSEEVGSHNYTGGALHDNILNDNNHSIQNSSLLSSGKPNKDGSFDLLEEGSIFNATPLQSLQEPRRGDHPDFTPSMHHGEVPLEYGEGDGDLSGALDEELTRSEVIDQENYVEVVRSNDFEEPMQVDDYEEPCGDNYIEEEQQSASSDDSYCNMGRGLLEKLDRDFLCSPRQIVRGVYRNEVLKLVVKRKLGEGNLVEWILTDTNRNKIVLLIKAQMGYNYELSNDALSTKNGFRAKGGWGWRGSGHGHIALFSGSDEANARDATKPKHMDLLEAVFWYDSDDYHVEGDNCRRSEGNCKDMDCGVRIWTLKVDSYHFDGYAQHQMKKVKHDQELYFSLVAFFSGDYKMLIHRETEKDRSFNRVAWLSKDISAPFDDRLEIDRTRIDKHKLIGETRAPRQPAPERQPPTYLADGGWLAGGEEENEVEVQRGFVPGATSTPQKRDGRALLQQQTTPSPTHSLLQLSQGDSINVEEFVDDYLSGGNEEEGSNGQDQSAECDHCHLRRGSIAKHLQDSTDCLKQLRAQPDFRFKGSDKLFIAKAAIIFGECPNPHCESIRHEVIPEECVAWWKDVGWDLLGWKGPKADADPKAISAKIKKMLANRKIRGTTEVPESQSTQCSQQPLEYASGTSICRSCEYQGDLVQHLHERNQCFEANVKHYISKNHPENNDDYTRRKLMFQLSAVLNTCARIECTSRGNIKYLGTHLAAYVQCHQFYQNEGVYLNLPNWSPEASSRIIGRKISQIKRKIQESKEKEDSDECKLFWKEIGELLSHVCFKCGTMGPVLEEEYFNMTFVGNRDDGLALWRCSSCSDQSPPFDEMKQTLKEEGERLRSGRHHERELKAVALQGSQVIFVPSKLAEGCIDGLYNGPTCSSTVLVPTQPPAIDTIIKECDKALQEKTELDKYVGDLLKRPIITDFQDFLSCTGVNKKYTIQPYLKYWPIKFWLDRSCLKFHLLPNALCRVARVVDNIDHWSIINLFA